MGTIGITGTDTTATELLTGHRIGILIEATGASVDLPQDTRTGSRDCQQQEDERGHLNLEIQAPKLHHPWNHREAEITGLYESQ